MPKVKTVFVESTTPTGTFYAERTRTGGLYIIKSGREGLTLNAYQTSLLLTLLTPGTKRRWWRRK